MAARARTHAHAYINWSRTSIIRDALALVMISNSDQGCDEENEEQSPSCMRAIKLRSLHSVDRNIKKANYKQGDIPLNFSDGLLSYSEITAQRHPACGVEPCVCRQSPRTRGCISPRQPRACRCCCSGGQFSQQSARPPPTHTQCMYSLSMSHSHLLHSCTSLAHMHSS